MIIETTDGCLIKDVVDDIGVKRQVDGVVDDVEEEDDDDDKDVEDGAVICVVRIWNADGTTAVTGPPTPADAADAATLVVVNIFFVFFFCALFS